MSFKRLTLSALLLFCFLTVSAAEARADNFIIQPGGDLVFVLTGSTQLSFTCFSGHPCSVSGNSVTFGTGANTTTFTLTGSMINTLVGNVSTPVTLASIQTSITGTGYVPPSNAADMGRLTITLTQNSPTAATRTISPFLSGPGGNYFLSFTSATSLATPTGPNPPGYTYGSIVFSFPATINLPVGTTNITTPAGAVPEPATLLLLGTGLAGVIGAAQRRRKRVREDTAE